MKIEKVGEVLVTDENVVVGYFIYKDYDSRNHFYIDALKWAQKRISDELERMHKEDKENIKNSIVGEKSKWTNVKRDTPIVILPKSYDKSTFRRYFAKYENGKVYYYPKGVTSWTWTGIDSKLAVVYEEAMEVLTKDEYKKTYAFPYLP